MSTQAPTIAEVRAQRESEIGSLLTAIFPPGAAVEIRVPPHGDRPHTYAGFFNDPAAAADAIVEKDMDGPIGIYFTVNPVKPELLARKVANRLHRAKRGDQASDADIMQRGTLFVDIDPERAGGICATDGERQQAIDVKEAVRRLMVDQYGFPDPIEIDSGNGQYLLFALDLPNDDESRDLVKQVLHGLQASCGTDGAKIDKNVYNASRIVRCPSTMNRKGVSTEDRPHRRCRVVNIPDGWRQNPATVDQLRAVAALAPVEAPAKPKRKAAAAAVASSVVASPVIKQQARRHIAAIPGAIGGQGGHSATFIVAQHLVRGFNLPDADALELLAEWNATCQPPWSEAELRHKVEEARTSGETIAFGEHLQTSATDGRPKRKVEIGTDEHRVVDEVCEELPRIPGLFQRSGKLVRVVCDQPAKDHIDRSAESPRIEELPESVLRNSLTTVVEFEAWGQKDNEPVLKPAHPPVWATRAIHDAGTWKGIPRLTGVVPAPTIRPDGSILSKPGYDEATGLLLADGVALPEIPIRPTQADAVRAAQRLLDVVQDFPFKEDSHRSAWLAALLTVLARHAFHGPAPLFLIDANTRGSGKSLLSDIIGLIATGACASRFSNPADDDEFRKRITALVMAGDLLVLIDNIAASLGCASLDAVLTAEVWKDRILGQSAVIEMPVKLVFLATGNNIQLHGDTSRRAAHIRLESPDERPEEREGFTHPDLRAYVRENRPALLADALTILSAYFAAGKPRHGLKPWGSFEAWSGLVREAVVWCGLPDPALTREELVESSDPQSAALAELLEGWQDIDPESNGLTAAGILRLIERNPERFEHVHTALSELCPTSGGKLPSVRQIGNRLKSLRGRVVDGKKLESVPARKGQQVWFVKSAERPERFGRKIYSTQNDGFSDPARLQQTTQTASDWSSAGCEIRQSDTNTADSADSADSNPVQPQCGAESYTQFLQPCKSSGVAAEKLERAETDSADSAESAPGQLPADPRPDQIRHIGKPGCDHLSWWQNTDGGFWCATCCPCRDRSTLAGEGRLIDPSVLRVADELGGW